MSCQGKSWDTAVYNSFPPFQMLRNVACPWAALSTNALMVKPPEQGWHQLHKAAVPVAT